MSSFTKIYRITDIVIVQYFSTISHWIFVCVVLLRGSIYSSRQAPCPLWLLKGFPKPSQANESREIGFLEFSFFYYISPHALTRYDQQCWYIQFAFCATHPCDVIGVANVVQQFTVHLICHFLALFSSYKNNASKNCIIY